MKSIRSWCRSTLPRRKSRGATSPQTCSSPSPGLGRQRAASLPRGSRTSFVWHMTSSSRNKKISTFTCRRMMWNLSLKLNNIKMVTPESWFVPTSPAKSSLSWQEMYRATTPSTAGRSSGSRGRRWRGTTSSSRRAVSSCRPLNFPVLMWSCLSDQRRERSRKTEAESDARPKSSVHCAYCQFNNKIPIKSH